MLHSGIPQSFNWRTQSHTSQQFAHFPAKNVEDASGSLLYCFCVCTLMLLLVFPYNILFQCMDQIISYCMYQNSVWEKGNKFTFLYLQFMDLISWALYFCMQEVFLLVFSENFLFSCIGFVAITWKIESGSMFHNSLAFLWSFNIWKKLSNTTSVFRRMIAIMIYCRICNSISRCLSRKRPLEWWWPRKGPIYSDEYCHCFSHGWSQAVVGLGETG